MQAELQFMGFLVSSGRKYIYMVLLPCFSARTLSQDLKLEKLQNSTWTTEALIDED